MQPSGSRESRLLSRHVVSTGADEKEKPGKTSAVAFELVLRREIILYFSCHHYPNFKLI